MAVTQRLDLRQSQTLVMTPQLQQAIKLLQLSHVELAEYVERELEQNPLLEREEAGEDRPTADLEAGADGDDSAAAAGETGATPDTLDQANSETLPQAADQPLDTDFPGDEDTGPAADWSPGDAAFENWGHGGNVRFETYGSSLEQSLGETVDLRQHLLLQLQMEITDPVDRMIGVHLIDLLDDAGYLTGDLAEVAALLSCETARVEATLDRLQSFEPPGVFARSLRECLALQLAERDRLDPAMEVLLDNLDLLASREAAKLKELCGVDDEDFAEMVAEVRALDPKPALAFDTQAAEPVVPDILMRSRRNDWLIELNGETLPRVLLNERYYARISKQVRSKPERAYIAEHFQSANWLIKSLQQRATTILKVATEIVRQQNAFFHKGVQHLRPLTLRDVAEAIEMHESTVSRVTSNKYIATPRGTYELKFFFSASIAATGNGAAHSAKAVRDRIKKLIDAEESAKVLSDDTIVELLRGDGIDIARRTIAKYRESMRIPSSVQRRREKSLEF
jgi:RNA polymerase sigma-54 factor